MVRNSLQAKFKVIFMASLFFLFLLFESISILDESGVCIPL